MPIILAYLFWCKLIGAGWRQRVNARNRWRIRNGGEHHIEGRISTRRQWKCHLRGTWIPWDRRHSFEPQWEQQLVGGFRLLCFHSSLLFERYFLRVQAISERRKPCHQRTRLYVVIAASSSTSSRARNPQLALTLSIVSAAFQWEITDTW